MQTKLFRRDFTLVVIGQIISLFGNAILRFALPLYLLRETGSSTLFGVVTACSFAPMVILSMAGGVLADRVNKRKDSLNELIQNQFVNQNRKNNTDIPQDFLVNHISGSFVEMVLWWIRGRMKQTPEELDRYFRAVIEPIL